MSASTPSVIIVGAGLSGAACATELNRAGMTVHVVDRGRAPGGRMSSPIEHGRRVDLGAAYFTVKDEDFGRVVADWTARGLVRRWTDTFTVLGPDGRSTTSGPVRYAARDGLRSLVRDLLPDELSLHTGLDAVDEIDGDAVVLAMPDPQAERLVGSVVEWVDYEPVIAIAAGWDTRRWTAFDAAFVNDDPDLSLLADDGARRGDDAAVLVLHTTPQRARSHLDAPQDAVGPAIAAAQRLLGFNDEPTWTREHRWTFAKPAGTHGDEPFGLINRGGRLLGLCTDSWCPIGVPRIESAWLSGQRLGRELAQRLA
ncbi:MAG: FAD-dependent oxidoreductase [Jatrophihabitans sp.]